MSAVYAFYSFYDRTGLPEALYFRVVRLSVRSVLARRDILGRLLVASAQCMRVLCREQRITGLAIHLLIGLSTLITAVLTVSMMD